MSFFVSSKGNPEEILDDILLAIESENIDEVMAYLDFVSAFKLEDGIVKKRT